MESKEHESIPNEYKECSDVSDIMIRGILYRIAKDYHIDSNDLDIDEYDLTDLDVLIKDYKDTDGASLRYYTDCIILHSQANKKKEDIIDEDRINIIKNIIPTCPEINYSVDDKGLLSIGFSLEQMYPLFK